MHPHTRSRYTAAATISTGNWSEIGKRCNSPCQGYPNSKSHRNEMLALRAGYVFFEHARNRSTFQTQPRRTVNSVFQQNCMESAKPFPLIDVKERTSLPLGKIAHSLRTTSSGCSARSMDYCTFCAYIFCHVLPLWYHLSITEDFRDIFSITIFFKMHTPACLCEATVQEVGTNM